MPSTVQIVLAAAFAGVGFAVPALQPRSLEGFSVPRVARLTGRTKKTGVELRVKTLAKYGHPIPDHLSALAKKHRVSAKKHQVNTKCSKGYEGSVPAYSATEYGDEDTEYDCPVTIGNDVLRMDFDTGSSDLWVYSTLQAKSATQGHNVYNVESGKRLRGETWNITYEDTSSAAGVVYADKVTIGGLTVTSQAVEAATAANAGIIDDTADDGVLGLAFDIINTVELNGQPKPAKTWFNNIRSRLPSPIFASALKHGPNDPGVYDFGFLNSSNYQGEIQYQPVNSSQGFWIVGTGNGITLDTGTTLAYWDDDAVHEFYRDVKGAFLNETAGGYVFPCSTKFTNDFSLQVGTVSSAIEAQYLNYGVADPSTPKTCLGALQLASDAGGDPLLGDVFLKGKYVVFGYDTKGHPESGIAWQPGHGPASSSR